MLRFLQSELLTNMRKSTLRVQGSLSFLLSGTGICVVLACMWYWMYVVLTWVWYWHVCGTIMCVALACVWYWQRAGMRFGRMRAIMQKCAAVSPPTPTTSTSPTPTQVPHLPLGREAPTQIPSSFPFSSIQPVCK